MEKKIFPNFELLSQEIKNHIDKLDEGTLFRTIESLGAIRHSMYHTWMHSDMKVAFEDVYKSDEKSATVQAYCLGRLRTLGIVPDAMDPETYSPKPDYWEWYRWYDKYYRALSQKEKDEWMDAIDENLPTDKWKPKGDWRIAIHR